MIFTAPSGIAAASAIVLLCACVFLQMLGVPGTTLLSPDCAPDLMASYVLEGLSVPSPMPDSHIVEVGDDPPERRIHLHLPLLTATVFHPPLT